MIDQIVNPSVADFGRKQVRGNRGHMGNGFGCLHVDVELDGYVFD
jgi:hypothetical protein